MARSDNTAVVVIALIGNLCITVSKFVAAALTGSAAMASEGVHSLADTTNELLLLYGLRRANAPPDARHPFGHGREAYFWTFIVALLILVVGASVSFYQGVSRLGNPHALTHMTAIYVVIAISFLFEGISWWAALRRVRSAKGALGYYEAFRASKDPSVFTVLLEDSAALLGLLAALAGTVLADRTGRPEFDAGASIVIALLLCATSFLLARETKALLIGEPARPELQQSILEIAGKEECIVHANGVVTVQLGPNHVFAGLSTEFRDSLTTPEIEQYVERVEAALRERHPEIVALYVKPQTHEVWEMKRRKILRTSAE
ncbi:MAG TPA: cation diffusion facilitator family transporter [Rhodanobacteraceae bacterium]|jgi:cation diffusion facilitator family transporter|nr:cation diffusion facilitator family transporter [Rhodanobacteraceae bacterium]